MTSDSNIDESDIQLDLDEITAEFDPEMRDTDLPRSPGNHVTVRSEGNVLAIGGDYHSYSIQQAVNSALISKNRQELPDHGVFSTDVLPIVHILREYGIVFLKNQYGAEKLVWEVAARFIKEHDKAEAKKEQHNIFQWDNNQNQAGVIGAISAQEDPSLVVITEVNRSEIPKIEQLFSSQHFIICTTDDNPEDWAPYGKSEMWVETSYRSIFPSEILHDYLFKSIEDLPVDNFLQQAVLQQPNNSPKSLKLREYLKKNLRLLQTPEGVQKFIARVQHEDNTTIKNNLQTFMNQAGELRQRDEFLTAYNRWEYENGTLQRLSLLAVMLEGVSTDQYFTLVEAIAGAKWGLQHPELHNVDYRSLAAVEQFFSFDSNGVNSQIDVKELRAELFNQLWGRSRRQIINFLKLLIDLKERELTFARTVLTSSKDRRRTFQHAIADTIGTLCKISFRDIELELLYLSISPIASLRYATAQGLAQWYHDDGALDHTLSEILRGWWNGTVNDKEGDLVYDLLSVMDGHNTDGGLTLHRLYVRMVVLDTTLQILRNANQISREFFDLFSELCRIFNDNNENYAPLITLINYQHLPWLILKHFRSLGDRLEQIAKYQSLHPGIASGLAIAHQFYPEKVLDILSHWRQKYQRQKPSKQNNTREQMLILIAETYSSLQEPKFA